MTTSSQPDTMMEDANAASTTNSNTNNNENDGSAPNSNQRQAMMHPSGEEDHDDDDEEFNDEDDDASFDSEYDSEAEDDDGDAEVELMQNLIESVKEQREENKRLTEAVIELHKNKKKGRQAAQHQAMFGRIMALTSSPPTGTENPTMTNTDNPQE
jgi:histone acetyltransferase (RNA polymerase elongator complex component)